MTPDGEPIESTGFAIDSTPNSRQRDPHITFDGGQYAVVYVHDAEPFTGVRLVRVLPDGTVLDPNPIIVYSQGSNSDTREPRVASNGTDYCVAWWDGFLRYALVGHDGALKVPPTNVPGSALQSGFELASDGDGFVITWGDSAVCCLHSTGITAVGAISASHTINSATGGSFIASNGETYLATWVQWENSQQYVRARPLGPTGAPTGPVVHVSGPHTSISPFGLFPDGDGFQLLTSGYRVFQLDTDGAPIGTPAMFSMPSGYQWGWTKGPGNSLLHTSAKWVSNPYNALRVQGRIVDLSPDILADITGDGQVNIDDLLAVIAAWGPCLAPPATCAADVTIDGVVNIDDLLLVIASWG